MRRILLSLALLVFAHTTLAADLSAFSGNYQLPNGTIIAIAEWEVDPSSPHVLAYTDFATGRIGVLTAKRENEFVLNSGIMGGNAVATLVFANDLDYQPDHGPRQHARRLPIKHEELTIHAAGADLHGTLFIPSGKGPFPAIVIVPAGRLHRTAAATFPNFFLSQGLAVLTYDRRDSSASFETYAADAVAAVNALARDKRIDGKHIGLWGHSQGGWLSLIAAASSKNISFIIDHSGMLLPAWQQELYRLSAEALADGVEPAEVNMAVAYETELMRVAQTGSGWNELMASLHAAGKARWVDLVYQPASLEELQQIWVKDFSFDPRPFAAKVHQPLLALFGGLDRSTPVESAANLVNAQRGHSSSLTVRFFPTADHAFLDAITGGNREIPALSRFVPGMFDEIRKWLRMTLTR